MKKLTYIIFIGLFLSAFPLMASDFFQQKLPSGKIIKIKGIGKIYFTEGEPALGIEYQTDTDIGDVVSLRKEAEEIWPVFRINVEKEKMVNAVIKASEPPKKTGLISHKYNSYSFILKKKDNGTWDFYSWGRDYEKEETLITKLFLSKLQIGDIPNTVNCLHYPEYFTKEQLDSEIRGVSKILTIVNNTLGSIESYNLNVNPIFYRYFALQTASLEYWDKYPVFNTIIYDAKFSKKENGFIIFRFSIVDDKIVINSILFGLPADKSDTENVLKELNDSIIKAFNNT